MNRMSQALISEFIFDIICVLSNCFTLLRHILKFQSKSRVIIVTIVNVLLNLEFKKYALRTTKQLDGIEVI